MDRFTAFASAQAINFGDLTLESDEDQLSIYGRLDLGHDGEALARIDHLIATLRDCRDDLAGAIGRQDAPAPGPLPTVPNPFA
jgi:hypothetical protein